MNIYAPQLNIARCSLFDNEQIGKFIHNRNNNQTCIQVTLLNFTFIWFFYQEAAYKEKMVR